MNVIETIAPISIENLKKYFTDKSIVYVIDYENSTLKGAKLLTYLSNLDLPADIKLSNTESDWDLLRDYLHSPMITNLISIERKVIEILMEYKGFIDAGNKEFIEHNKEILNKWSSKLDSLTIYNMYMVNSQEFKDFALSHTEDSTDELVGVNFVSLLKHPQFYSFYSKIEKEKVKFYSKYFNDYMFKGKSLFSYWANENNPLFLLTYGLSEGIVTGQDYVRAKEETIKGLTNVAPIQ